MGHDFVPAEAGNKLEDLSGVVIEAGQNPFEALIQACNDNPAEIQALYSLHRTRRNEQQKQKFLADDFKELVIDPYLLRLENPSMYPGFEDDRNGIVLWARPPNHILRLAEHLQRMLRKAAPNIWLMPTHCMHMTALELTHSRTPQYTFRALSVLRPVMARLANFTHTHRARLVKPMISYDISAFALSFLPADGEPVVSPPPAVASAAEAGPVVEGDGYSYHHVRHGLFALASDAGNEINSRYQVPSAHVTLGRYLGHADHATPAARRAWIGAIEDANAWLESKVWGVQDGEFVGEWIVGQEKGLDCRVGAIWYGGGRTVMMGEGF